MYFKNRQFTDTSTGPEAVRRIWLYGEGTMSVQDDPEITYTNQGTYDVQLFIKWRDCDGITNDWESSSRTIRVP